MNSPAAGLGALLIAIAILSPAAPIAQDDDAITISKSDFNRTISDIMESIGHLESLAATSTSTADYARAYSRLQGDLARVRPPVSEWTESDRNRLRDLPEPTQAAWEAMDAEDARTQERLRQREEESRRQWEAQLETRRQEEAERARQERQDLAAQEQRARIEELEARTDYYDRATNSYYHRNWWWSNRWGGHHHGRPGYHRPHRPHRNPGVGIGVIRSTVPSAPFKEDD